MLDLYRSLIALKDDRRGVTALEYGIIAGVLGLTLVAAFTTLGGKFTTLFNTIGSSL